MLANITSKLSLGNDIEDNQYIMHYLKCYAF